MIEVNRSTSETNVSVKLGDSDVPDVIDTSIPFLDHMMAVLSRYSGVPFNLLAKGDLEHHISEDVAISLGLAFARLLPEMCARYGNATIPMDDALVVVGLDAGGRAFYSGNLNDERFDHFFRSFCENARFTLHVDVRRGENRHHIVEAAFKAFGMSLRQALVQADSVFSTKGSVSLEVNEC